MHLQRILGLGPDLELIRGCTPFDRSSRYCSGFQKFFRGRFFPTTYRRPKSPVPRYVSCFCKTLRFPPGNRFASQYFRLYDRPLHPSFAVRRLYPPPRIEVHIRLACLETNPFWSWAVIVD